MIATKSDKITGYHWILFFICFFGTAFAGTVSTLMSVYLPVAVKDLLGNTHEAELNSISAYINAVFIFGGAVIRGFAFALIIGIIFGTYSSIFVATPIVIDFTKKKMIEFAADKTKKQSASVKA